MKCALFIDDSPDLRSTVSEIAYHEMGLMVLVFPTWAAAARAAGHSDEVVLVVSDFDFGLLDDMNGYEVLTLAKRQWPECRTILCSGLSREPNGYIDRFISKVDLTDLFDEFTQALGADAKP